MLEKNEAALRMWNALHRQQRECLSARRTRRITSFLSSRRSRSLSLLLPHLLLLLLSQPLQRPCTSKSTTRSG